MKRYKLILFFNIFILLTASAQKIENLVELKQQSENRLFHRLDKAPRTPAFASEGYWVWGSSIVKGDDGKYHMFVSRFPQKLPFHPGWMVASEIVHVCPIYRKDLIVSVISHFPHAVHSIGTGVLHTIRAY